MNALKLRFMCIAFVSASPGKIIFLICVSGLIINSLTMTLYKSVTAKHLKAGSLYSPLLWLKKITACTEKVQ